MIRSAKFGDIPDIVRVCRAVHEASDYAKMCEISERDLKALLVNAIQRHGGRKAGATFVAVGEAEGRSCWAQS